MTTETKPSLCIVGAGIAGLSAGIYGRLNGFSTHIFEKHALPGGLCTAWKRGGYWFDGCVHYLLGSGPDQWGYALMSQVGLVGERPFIDHDAWTSVETQSGARVAFYADIDRLEQNLIEVAKQDAAPDDAAHDVAHNRAFAVANAQVVMLFTPVNPELEHRTPPLGSCAHRSVRTTVFLLWRS